MTARRRRLRAVAARPLVPQALVLRPARVRRSALAQRQLRAQSPVPGQQRAAATVRVREWARPPARRATASASPRAAARTPAQAAALARRLAPVKESARPPVQAVWASA